MSEYGSHTRNHSTDISHDSHFSCANSSYLIYKVQPVKDMQKVFDLL